MLHSYSPTGDDLLQDILFLKDNINFNIQAVAYQARTNCLTTVCNIYLHSNEATQPNLTYNL